VLGPDEVVAPMVGVSGAGLMGLELDVDEGAG